MPAGISVQVRLSDNELRDLDGYRREKLNPPSRGRALRELARIALHGPDVLGNAVALREPEVRDQAR